MKLNNNIIELIIIFHCTNKWDVHSLHKKMSRILCQSLENLNHSYSNNSKIINPLEATQKLRLNKKSNCKVLMYSITLKKIGCQTLSIILMVSITRGQRKSKLNNDCIYQSNIYIFIYFYYLRH